VQLYGGRGTEARKLSPRAKAGARTDPTRRAHGQRTWPAPGTARLLVTNGSNGVNSGTKRSRLPAFFGASAPFFPSVDFYVELRS